MSKKKSPNSVFDVYTSGASVLNKFCTEFVGEDAGVPNLDAGGVESGVDGGVEFGVDGGVEFGVDGGVEFGVDSGVEFGVDGGVQFAVDLGLGSDRGRRHVGTLLFSKVTELMSQVMGFP